MKNVKVIYRNNNKWYTGKINELGKLRKGKEIKRMNDAKDVDQYITLKRYIKDNKKSFTAEEILKHFDVESIYVKQVIEEKVSLKDTIKTTSNKKFWEKYNPLCLKCTKKCKQSYRVRIVSCNRTKEEKI